MYRIVEEEDGFVVEVVTKNIVFKDEWKPFITYMGFPDKPYKHKTYEGAMENLLTEIKKSVEFIPRV